MRKIFCLVATVLLVASCGKEADKEISVVVVTSVTLNSHYESLTEGETVQLTATVSPADKSITWSCSDPSVATVTQDGMVTAIAAGKASVFVRADDKEDKCTVTVFQKIIPVSEIKLDRISLDLIEGESEVLHATLIPSDATNNDVSWSSSAPSVATVSSDGLVTAVAPGRATIIALADGKVANCRVTVKERPVPVSGITVSPSTLDLVEGETWKLIAVVQPSNASDPTVTWSTSASSIATVSSDGVVTALAPGTATITAKAGNYTATCVVTVDSPEQNSEDFGDKDGQW